MSARQEDFVFAEHVLRRGFATEEQVQEALDLLDRVRGEMQLDETLEGILLKKGYLAQAQSQVIRDAINPAEAGRSRNQIEGYRLLSRLGSGAMGSVYKALHTKLDILVALKVLRVELAKSKTQVERLKREAQLAARLNHPNIVRSLDVGESNGFHYFAMEFVDGPTARGLIREGRMKEKDALRIVTAVARALEHAHANGVIHRDIKPANIMISKGGAQRGTIKLGDFGLARGQGPSELTLEHAAIGTPQYLAPEQAASAANASPRSDLFSLGASLYHLVTGQPPFTGENLAEIFGKVIQGRFEPPETVVDDLSIDTLYLIHRLMRPNPRDRYATAAELVQDLERLQAGERIAPDGFKGDYQSFLDQRRQKRMLVGGLAVAVIAASSWFTVHTIRSSQQREQALADCRALNDEGRGELEALSTLPELQAKRTALQSALESRSCATDLVSDLQRRIESLDRDATKLDEAERILLAAQGDQANYRALARRLDPILPGLRGARQRRDFIARELRRLSDDAAQAAKRKVYQVTYADVDEATEALTALQRALEDVYLPIEEEWASDVGPHLREIENLKRAYATASRQFAENFETSLGRGDFDSAARYLENWHQEWSKARQRATTQRLPDRFLQLFPIDDPERRNTLSTQEGTVWTALRTEISELDRDGRPDLALKRVERFISNAEGYRKTAELERTRLQRRVEQLEARQLQAFDELERTFRSALAARQYGAAVRLATTKIGETNWFGGAALKIAGLQKRVRAVEDLHTRFWKRMQKMRQVPITGLTGQRRPATAPGSAFQKASGNDPDRYVLKLGDKEYPFTLSDLDRATLKSIFGFRDEVSSAAHAYFEVAEAYRLWEQDPYEAVRLLNAARQYLFNTRDAWLDGVVRQLGDLEKRIRDAEATAVQLMGTLTSANGRNDHENALDCCNRLLKEFGWTRTVKEVSDSLTRSQAKLRGYVGVGLQRRNSAIPPKFYRQPDPKQPNLIRIRYTGAEWHPLAKDVPEKATEKEKAAWLALHERKFLQRQFIASPRGIKQFDEFARRATHQLLDWGGAVDVRRPKLDLAAGAKLDPPGYMLRVARNRSPWEAWWHGRKAAFEGAVIRLTNHFRHDRNWSIEFTVEWDEVSWKTKWLEGGKVKQASEKMSVPDYFAVSAGKVQAAIGYFPYANGGVAGTRILLRRFDDRQRRTERAAVRIPLAHGDRSQSPAHEAQRPRLARSPALRSRLRLPGPARTRRQRDPLPLRTAVALRRGEGVWPDSRARRSREARRQEGHAHLVQGEHAEDLDARRECAGRGSRVSFHRARALRVAGRGGHGLPEGDEWELRATGACCACAGSAASCRTRSCSSSAATRSSWGARAGAIFPCGARPGFWSAPTARTSPPARLGAPFRASTRASRTTGPITS